MIGAPHDCAWPLEIDTQGHAQLLGMALTCIGTAGFKTRELLPRLFGL
jgi:hypothetical protein